MIAGNTIRTFLKTHGDGAIESGIADQFANCCLKAMFETG